MKDKDFNTADKPELLLEHAREHLANERTFLAWVRTSLAIVGIGFVVVKFSLFVNEMRLVAHDSAGSERNWYSLLIGILLVAMGSVMTLIAFRRFTLTRRCINTGSFYQSMWPIKALTMLVVVSGVLLILYLLET